MVLQFIFVSRKVDISGIGGNTVIGFLEKLSLGLLNDFNS